MLVLNDVLIFNPWIASVVLWVLGIVTILAAVCGGTYLLNDMFSADSKSPISKFAAPSFGAFIVTLITAVFVIAFSHNLDSYQYFDGYEYSETSDVVESVPIVSLDHGFDMSGTISGSYYVRSVELEQEKYFMYITKRGTETEYGQEYQENKIGADNVRIFEKDGVESPSLNTIEECEIVIRESDGATRRDCSSYRAFIIPKGSIEHKTSIN